MAFDWREFLLLAHELRKEPQESKRRTAVGRAYYYVYNAAKIEAQKMGFDENDPSLRRMGLHQRLWSWCLKHERSDVKDLGDSGNTLKARRTKADYDARPLSLQIVEQQLDETRKFEVLLAQIAGTFPPQPLP